MARQRTSTFEDMIMIVSRFPWWVGLMLALASYLVLHTFASRPVTPIPAGPEQMSHAINQGLVKGLVICGQYILPLVFGLGAMFSAIAAVRQKKIYNAVVSRPGIATLNEMSWEDFERLVSEYFRRNGFQVTRVGGNGPDGGIDLVLRMKSETYLVQCKQWNAYKVGVWPVREFYGVMTSQGAAGGYFVTSGVYTEEAKAFVEGLNLMLIDGRKLREMIDVASKVAASVTTVASRPTSTSPVCPKCGSEMIKRVARQGANAGNEFWGCITYPKCKGIWPIGEINR
jgi:restriction system protein